MKKLKVIVVLLLLACFGGCSTNKNSNSSSVKAGEVRTEDQTTVSLLNQIRRLSGIRVEGGVPVLTRGTNSLQGSVEPLYVVDGYVVGNSFSSVNGVVNSSDVKSIQVIKSEDASFYGTRGSNGVIKITTKTAKKN